MSAILKAIMRCSPRFKAKRSCRQRIVVASFHVEYAMLLVAIVLIAGPSQFIAFTAGKYTQNGQADLYVCDLSGAHVHRVARGAVVTDYAKSDIVWSPHADRIAFTRRVGTDETGFLVNRDGSGLRSVDAHKDKPIVWKDQGHLFVRRNEGSSFPILLIDLRTGRVRHTSFDPYNRPSPDGKHKITNDPMCVKDIRSGRRVAVTNEPDDSMMAIWSPDSRWLAVNRGMEGSNALSIVKTDASGVRIDLAVAAGDCSWSPDGRYLAMSESQGNEAAEIAVLDTKTRRLRKVAKRSQDNFIGWTSDQSALVNCWLRVVCIW